MPPIRTPHRIGVFGGTFNPIHVCHLLVADRVRVLMNLDCVRFVPAKNPPHKTAGLAPATHRFEMVKLAIQGYPHFAVDGVELARSGPSYSVDTMEHFRRSEPDTDWYFLLGIDMFRELSSWKDPDRLVNLCQLIVIGRAGESFESLAGSPWLGSQSSDGLRRLDMVAGEVTESVGPRRTVHLVRPAPCDVSSTQVRRALTQGDSAKKLLPASVHSYILRNRLYGVP